MVTLGVLLWPGGLFRQSLGLLTDIRKTFTPWSSVSMAVMRMLFSLALSICIWAHSLVLRISRRLPWVRITATNEATQPWPLTPSNSQLGEQTHLAGKRTPRAKPTTLPRPAGHQLPPRRGQPGTVRVPQPRTPRPLAGSEATQKGVLWMPAARRLPWGGR